MKIYTIGYSGRTPSEIAQLAELLDAIVFDVRYSPRSRNPGFSRKRLSELLDDRYRHVKALGNVNYKGTYDEVALLDWDAGLAAIADADKDVILMCVCSDYETCHRHFIAERLIALGYSVEEADLESLTQLPMSL